MINRSVIGKRAPGSQPLQKDQISTLKQKAIRVEEIEGIRRTTVWDYLVDLWTTITYSFQPKDRQCNIYGHTLPTSGWTVGRLPKCVDCGTPINHPEELRKALPRDW